MRIEVCGKDNYNIFVNRMYAKSVNFSSKDDIVKFVKELAFKVRSRLRLCGFYKIKVFPHDKIGIFIEIIKLDDLELSNSLDLRILVYQDECFFFETEDYFVIEKCNDKRYMDGKFYCVVDDYFEELLEKVEFGRFIYGKEVINLLNNGLNL